MLICNKGNCVLFSGRMYIKQESRVSYGTLDHSYTLYVVDDVTGDEVPLITEFTNKNMTQKWFDYIIEQAKKGAVIADLRYGAPIESKNKKCEACDPNYERHCL